MQEAIRLGREGMKNNEGGPFGCVIVKDGQIVGRGNNQVLFAQDPTAHAEMVAIRDACKHLASHLLEGCEVYTSCEPCPMCLGAVYWAKISKIYYASTRADAHFVGFDDQFIYEELQRKHESRKLVAECVGREEGIKLFEEWNNKTDKEFY